MSSPYGKKKVLLFYKFFCRLSNSRFNVETAECSQFNHTSLFCVWSDYKIFSILLWLNFILFHTWCFFYPYSCSWLVWISKHNFCKEEFVHTFYKTAELYSLPSLLLLHFGMVHMFGQTSLPTFNCCASCGSALIRELVWEVTSLQWITELYVTTLEQVWTITCNL